MVDLRLFSRFAQTASEKRVTRIAGSLFGALSSSSRIEASIASAATCISAINNSTEGRLLLRSETMLIAVSIYLANA